MRFSGIFILAHTTKRRMQRCSLSGKRRSDDRFRNGSDVSSFHGPNTGSGTTSNLIRRTPTNASRDSSSRAVANATEYRSIEGTSNTCSSPLDVLFFNTKISYMSESLERMQSEWNKKLAAEGMPEELE